MSEHSTDSEGGVSPAPFDYDMIRQQLDLMLSREEGGGDIKVSSGVSSASDWQSMCVSLASAVDFEQRRLTQLNDRFATLSANNDQLNVIKDDYKEEARFLRYENERLSAELSRHADDKQIITRLENELREAGEKMGVKDKLRRSRLTLSSYIIQHNFHNTFLIFTRQSVQSVLAACEKVSTAFTLVGGTVHDKIAHSESKIDEISALLNAVTIKWKRKVQELEVESRRLGEIRAELTAELHRQSRESHDRKHLQILVQDRAQLVQDLTEKCETLTQEKARLERRVTQSQTQLQYERGKAEKTPLVAQLRQQIAALQERYRNLENRFVSYKLHMANRLDAEVELNKILRHIIDYKQHKLTLPDQQQQ